MVITLSFLGLEGQTSSFPEDDGMTHGRLHNSVMHGRKVAESCGGDDGISSQEEEVCPCSPKNERSMTMVIFLLSPVESCGDCHGISPRAEEVCPLSPKK